MSLKKDRNKKSADFEYGLSIWQKLSPYRLWIYGSAGALIFVLASFGFWSSYREKMDSSAWQKLGEKSDPEILKQIVADYPQSMPSRMALLSLADESWKKGDYKAALDHYEHLERDPAMKPFRDLIQNRRAESLLMLGKFAEAQKIFLELSQDGDSLISTLSVIQQARTLYLMGEIAQANELMRKARDTSGFGSWGDEAEAFERKLKSIRT